MTREEALSLARVVAELDGVPLIDPIRAEQRPRGRGQGLVWAIFSHYNAVGHNAGLVIDDRTGVVLSKQYVGFGGRLGPRGQASEFMGDTYSPSFSVLEGEQLITDTRARVFRFLTDLANVRSINPPSLELATPLPCVLEVGSLVDWRLHFRGRNVAWSLRVEELRADARLVEVQQAGPFRWFRHVLVFLDAPGGTLLRERVEYRLPWGVLGELGDPLLGVTRAIEDGLDFRCAAIATHLGEKGASTPTA